MVTIFLASAIVFVVVMICLSLSLIIRKTPIKKKCAGCTCEDDRPGKPETCSGEHSAEAAGD